ncbi:cerevisin [Acrasis kona]|uniref:Cerevisin n=1 Tax=Acrasis kona TaxID=1008807 RepID=A0AAW2ZHA1_9EUKA
MKLLCVLLLVVTITYAEQHKYIIKTLTNNALDNISTQFKSNMVIKGEFNFGEKSGIIGFVAVMDEQTAAALGKENNIISITKSQELPPIRTIDIPYKNSLARVVQKNVTYGLDMIDRVMDGNYVFNGTGEGVNIFIVDSGVKDDHPEFEGRVKWGFSISDHKDTTEHGTHVAGIAASKTFGVAKKATLISVKVMNDDRKASTADVILGLNYVLSEHKSSGKPSVVNMSFGGSHYVFGVLQEPIMALVEAGIAFSTSAGNNSEDACSHAPGGRLKGVLCVAASDKDYNLSMFSNFGECVNIVAPGDEILSTCVNTPTCYKTGTSMASPVVAGVLAQAYSMRKFKNVQEAYDFVLKNSQTGVLKHLIRQTPDLLVSTPKY